MVKTLKTKKSKWRKLKPFKGRVFHGCLNCPPVKNVASLGMLIGVGLGTAVVTKNKKTVYDENDLDGTALPPPLREFERMAQKDPDCDWRVVMDAPLRMRVYQRHGKNKWVLIKSGPGFA